MKPVAKTLQYRSAWHTMWHLLNLPDPDPDRALLQTLVACYSEPHRHYHTLQHLDACFAHFAILRDQAKHPAEVQLALWFHDAVYDIGVPGNESRSAQWARSELLAAGADPARVERVVALVMATCHDRPPLTTDEQILLDVDLAILGAPMRHFDAYETQVRAEYANVPVQQFRSNRRRILQAFLDRPRIFHTAHFHNTREQQARANLQRSIDRLAQWPADS